MRVRGKTDEPAGRILSRQERSAGWRTATAVKSTAMSDVLMHRQASSPSARGSLRGSLPRSGGAKVAPATPGKQQREEETTAAEPVHGKPPEPRNGAKKPRKLPPLEAVQDRTAVLPEPPPVPSRPNDDEPNSARTGSPPASAAEAAPTGAPAPQP